MTTRTDQVLASARKDVESQLKLVRAEMARLEGEERTLTQALASLDGGSPSTATQTGNGSRRASSGGQTTRSTRRSARKATPSRRRSRRAPAKSTAERVEELRRLLAAGPRSRNDLASGLNVSPARVQQLLAELGSSVTSQPHPNRRGGKLWSLDGRANGAGAAKSPPARRRRTAGPGAKGGRARKSAAK